MSKLTFLVRLLIGFGLWALIIGGCAYPIKYKLNENDIVLAKSTVPIKVQVATFSDKRNSIERQKSERKKEGHGDVGDYTYDQEFKGEVAEAISNMIVSHLKYARSFTEVELSPYDSEGISKAALDSLAQRGVDAVMVGEIDNFYGYYDNNSGRQFLYGFGLGIAFGLPVYMASTSEETRTFYGPYATIEYTEEVSNPIPGAVATALGVSLGFYLESLHKRNIERHTTLSAKMISTSTHRVLWQDTFEIHQKERKVMPGWSTEKRKFEVAIGSLRDAVNQMVESLSNVSLSAAK